LRRLLPKYVVHRRHHVGKKSASRRGDLVAAAMGAYVSRLWPSDPLSARAFDGNLQSKIPYVYAASNHPVIEAHKTIAFH